MGGGHLLVKARLYPDEESVLRSALRALFQARPEIRRQMLVAAYVSGEIGLGKAAAMPGISCDEVKGVIVETGAQIHLGPRTVAEALRDAANA